MGPTKFSGKVFHGSNNENPIDTRVAYQNFLLLPKKPGSSGIPFEKISPDSSSLTIGHVLYTTPAEDYAGNRAQATGGTVHEIDVDKATLYDFRTKEGTNGHVPIDVAMKWRDYFLENMHCIEEFFVSKGEGGIKRYQIYLKSQLEEYGRYLEGFIKRLQKGDEVSVYYPYGLGTVKTPYSGKRDLSLRDMCGNTRQ